MDEKDEYYIVMELMSKGDLLNRLRNDSHFGRFNNRFLAIVDVLRGLAYLEMRQVVHRDIAARNVLVDDKYNCKISDFGLGKPFGDNIYCVDFVFCAAVSF
jgi:serine/threonine protein kinase